MRHDDHLLPEDGDTKKNSRVYRQGEPLFGATVLDCLANGWTLIPQERGERRRSAIIDGRALKWGEYIDKPPTLKEAKHWAAQVPAANGAILMGKPSGNVFCLDIDVLEEKLVLQIIWLADEIFGATPFTRQGMAPKVAMFYRVETEEELPPNRSWRFMNAAHDAVGEDMLEIQARGKLVTAYGYHHKTERYFGWGAEGQPAADHVTKVPLVTMAQIEQFIERVQDIRPFHRNTGVNVTNATWDAVEVEGVRIPKLRSMSATSGWVENPETGLIVDGRELFLWSFALQTVRMNVAACHSPNGEQMLQKSVFEGFKQRAEMSGKWTERYLREEVVDKVGRAVRDVREGRISEYRERKQSERIPQEKREKSAPLISSATDADDGSLAFLPPTPNGKASVKKSRYRADTSEYVVLTERDETAFESRRLIPDRTEITERVQDALGTALDEFFGEVYDDDPETIKPIHVLKAPTGAGKTTRTIRYIAEDPRTKQWDDTTSNGRETPGPILFLLPTYNNIDELRTRASVLNLDSSLSDEDLGKQALEFGLVSVDSLEAVLEDLKRDAINAGLETMVYRGKIAAGCLMQDKVKMLMDAGIGTSGLCKAKVTPKDGEPEEITCIHYTTCPAIQQRNQIQRSHVVFLPHAFLTLKIPEELQKVRAVVADERIFPLFVHTTTFKLITLGRARKEPRLTPKEREAGLSPLDLLQDRDQAADIAHQALIDRRCPAQALADFVEKRGDKRITGADLVRSALRVCGSAISANAMINPDMSDAEIRELCSKPTGTEVSEEYRFWKIVEERIGLLIPDQLYASLAGDRPNPMPKRAKGNREMRIQYIKEEDANGGLSELIRISWRSEPNWSGAPLLLLDASASPRIISKLFGQREVKVHDIDAPLNVKTILVVDSTYSNASVVAKIGGFRERLASGKVKEKLQRVLSAASALYGFGRVVCGSSVALRRAFNTDWAAPSNVDFCHYGATRGLDFAKHHSAAVSFGRMEIPTRTVDGIVAALTYDDDEPEEPFDLNGEGTGPDGNPLRPPSEYLPVPLRSGQDAHIPTPLYPGAWARIVQMQYREEELRQFVGRLRPVYRKGEAPVWIAVSKVIPDGIVVDEIVTLDDLIKWHGTLVETWNAVRRTDGVLSAELAFETLPFTYESVEDWATELQRMGFDENTGVLDPSNRFVWGFTPVKYRDETGDHYAFVRSDLCATETAAATAVEDAFAVHLGRVVDVVEVGQPVKARRQGVAREDDWVSLELGDLVRRRLDENESMTTSTTHAVRFSAPSAFNTMGNRRLPRVVTYAFQKEDRTDYLPLTISELAAGLATEKMWNRVFAGADEVVTGPVIDPSVPTERMAEGAFDDDGT